MAPSKPCSWCKTYMRSLGWSIPWVSIGGNTGWYWRFQIRPRSFLPMITQCSSGIKLNFTKSQFALYPGMYPKLWKNNKRKELVKKWQMSHSLTMSEKLWAEKLKPEWKKGNWVCVYKRIPILGELSNSTSGFGETWLKWWLRCFVS